MRLRIFAEPHQGTDYETLLRAAKTAEQGGFDGFFRSDHYLKMGTGPGLPGPTDAWATLAGLARETSTIRLGTLMTAATFRLPGPLAILVATVDRMSAGRVDFGFGTGWFRPEHSAYGIPFPHARERFDRFEEQLRIITGLWATPEGQQFSFDGVYYQLQDSPALPKPYAGKPAIIIGGTGLRRTPQLAARFADEFNVAFRNVIETGKAFDRVRVACQSEARHVEPIYSAVQAVCCGRNDAEVAQRALAIGQDVSQLRSSGLTGSPAELVERLAEFAQVGCQRVYLQVLDLEDAEHLELLASEVLPNV